MKVALKLLILSLFLNVFTPVFAIEWIKLISPRGRVVYLDKDSITKFNGSYFYNIKFQNHNQKEFVILTVQSGIKHQFSARLKTYNLNEYETLQGDYLNITSNATTKLEPITYDSIVNTCYKEVKRIMQPQQAPLIEVK